MNFIQICKIKSLINISRYLRNFFKNKIVMTSKLKGLMSQNTVKPCYLELNRTEFFPGILDIIIQDIRFNIVLSETIAITSVFTLIDIFEV